MQPAWLISNRSKAIPFPLLFWHGERFALQPLHMAESPGTATAAEKHLHVRCLLGDLLPFAALLLVTKLKEARSKRLLNCLTATTSSMGTAQAPQSGQPLPNNHNLPYPL